MNIFNDNNNDDKDSSFSKSRFQVIPRNDIELTVEDLAEFRSPTPFTGNAIICDQDQSNEPLVGLEENGNNNTVTTTSSSTNSFYNTMYKYRKLKQNGNSLDTVFIPPPNRRPSTYPHSLVGVPFYNERILVYNFLQRPTGAWAIGYHVFVSLAVVCCLILTIISTSSSKLFI